MPNSTCSHGSFHSPNGPKGAYKYSKRGTLLLPTMPAVHVGCLYYVWNCHVMRRLEGSEQDVTALLRCVLMYYGIVCATQYYMHIFISDGLISSI